MNTLFIFLHHRPNCLTKFLASLDHFINTALKEDTVVQFSAVIAGFISITLPIALDIVSRQTENYKDRELSESFLTETTYRIQVYGILPLAFVSIILYALGVKSGYFIWSIIILDAIAMINFILFIRVVQQYATNFDNYYSTKLKQEADEIIQERKKD